MSTSNNFSTFVKADSVPATLNSFATLYDGQRKGLKIYRSIRKHNNSIQFRGLWKSLDEQLENAGQYPAHLLTVIVGGGPAGLRMAIQCALQGGDVTGTYSEKNNNQFQLNPADPSIRHPHLLQV